MSIVLLTIFFVILFFYCILMLLYWSGWKSLSSYQVNDTTIIRLPRISVIVAARNEEANLPALLQSMAAQDYPALLWELIIVDDHSEDRTAEMAESFEMGNLKTIRMEGRLPANVNAYKKKALETGIGASCGELIVTTDADCIINSRWLTTIGSFYAEHPCNMIVMPVHMLSDGGWMGIFQQLDFMSLQGITGAATKWRIHGMCNGANLAYTRNSFYEVGGFSGIDQMASGDDMMLLQKMKHRWQNGIRYLLSPNVIVLTSPQRTMSDFFSQRIRWAGKAGNYPDATMLPVLMIVYLFNLALLILMISTAIQPLQTLPAFNWTNWQLLTGTLLIKTVLEIFFLIPVARFFENSRSLWIFPLLQPLHICYTVLAGAMGLMPTYQWKGRKVR